MSRTATTSRCVLFIGPRADEHAALRRIFHESPWDFQSSFTSREGIDLLRRNYATIRVVICERSLPDGDWGSVLTALDKVPVQVSLIVTSRLADERLWAEVLNLGAFDLVLGRPFDPEEVLRVTDNAWSACTASREYEDARANRLQPQAARETRSRRLVATSGF